MTLEFDSWEGEGGRIYKPSLRDSTVSFSNKFENKRVMSRGFSAGTNRGLSLRAINANLNKHNKKVAKARSKLGCIPVVFYNYNTGAR